MVKKSKSKSKSKSKINMNKYIIIGVIILAILFLVTKSGSTANFHNTLPGDVKVSLGDDTEEREELKPEFDEGMSEKEIQETELNEEEPSEEPQLPDSTTSV